jgi:Na+-transporting NADH:ubiquinone oxidoreductase subunit A
VLQSVVIRLDGHEEVSFEAHDASRLASLPAERVREQLLQSGLWTALRTRPYSKVPQPASTPAAIFVTAMDSNPLAPDPEPIIRAHAADFSAGLTVLSRLTQGEVFVCRAPGAQTPVPDLQQLRVAEFAGPHPAGLPGTHIHFLKPAGATRTVWHIGYQDVIAVGKLFTTGRLWTERVIALAGPLVKQPRLIRTQIGANVEELISGQIHNVEGRALSGSVFNGRSARGWAAYLSPYHNQITVLGEGRHREMFGWDPPGRGSLFQGQRVLLRAAARHTHVWLHHHHQRLAARHGADRQLRVGDAAGYPAHATVAVSAGQGYGDGAEARSPGAGRGRPGPVLLRVRGQVRIWTGAAREPRTDRGRRLDAGAAARAAAGFE